MKPHSNRHRRDGAVSGGIAGGARGEKESSAVFAVAPVLGLVIAVLAVPLETSAKTTLEPDAVGRVLDTAASYEYQKRVARKSVAGACYFDPKVATSMRCSWRANEPGSDMHAMRQGAKRDARTRCKKAGGRSCKLFWRDGKLRYRGLAPETDEKLKAIFETMTGPLPEPRAVPEETSVGAGFWDAFPNLAEFWEKERAKLKKQGRELRYAICANAPGTWSSYAMLGADIEASNLHAVCVAKCDAVAAWYSSEGPCYVFYADGEFASTEAEKALIGDE